MPQPIDSLSPRRRRTHAAQPAPVRAESGTSLPDQSTLPTPPQTRTLSRQDRRRTFVHNRKLLTIIGLSTVALVIITLAALLIRYLISTQPKQTISKAEEQTQRFGDVPRNQRLSQAEALIDSQDGAKAQEALSLLTNDSDPDQLYLQVKAYLVLKKTDQARLKLDALEASLKAIGSAPTRYGVKDGYITATRQYLDLIGTTDGQPKVSGGALSE